MQQDFFVGGVSLGKVLAWVVAVTGLMALAWPFAAPVGAQQGTVGDATAQAGDSTAGAAATPGAAAQAQTTNADGPLVFAEGEQTATGARALATAQEAGPLSGTRVSTRSTDADAFVERILIPRPDCDLVRGETASFVLEDEDGTQAAFTEDTDAQPGNIRIEEVRAGLLVTSDPDFPQEPAEPNDIVPLNERGGDDVLDTGGLTVVTSTGIRCEGAGNNTGGNNTGGNNAGGNNAGGNNTDGNTNTGGTNTGGTNTGNTDTDDTDTGNTNTGSTNTAVGAAQTDVTGNDTAETVVVGRRTATERQYGEIINIPDQKTLADTGGMPLGLWFIGLALLGMGVPLFWLVIRRTS